MTQLDFTAPKASLVPDQRRGACPTLREPMRTGDGLLARLRVAEGVIAPRQVQALAALADQFGNGQIEITARGNLQVRGLRADGVVEFARGVEAIIAIETGLVIETSPLAGLDLREIADPRPLAEAIRRAVDGGALQAALGPKVTVVVDGGGRIGRDALSADIRLTAVDAAIWALEVGGNGLGLLCADDAAGAVWAVLSLIAELGLTARGRDLDATAMRRALAPLVVAEEMASRPARPAPEQVELSGGRSGAVVRLAFGAASAGALGALAAAAQAAGIEQLQLAPHHGLLAICASDAQAEQFCQAAAGLGYVTAASDPRRAISACIGSDGCASGNIAARLVAETLAQAEPDLFDGSWDLHVSGCAKGCAHPGTALVTLVANGDGVDLVINGSAKGAPAVTMPRDAVPQAMRRLKARVQDERKLGESVASCFKRLGAASIAAAVRQGWQ